MPLVKFHCDGVSSQCNFNIVCVEQTGTYRFKTGFYGLTDMPKEFQKAMDNTLQSFLLFGRYSYSFKRLSSGSQYSCG